MKYVFEVDNTVVDYLDIKAANKESSIPADGSYVLDTQSGKYRLLRQTSKPTDGYVVGYEAALINGEYVQSWITRPFTDVELSEKLEAEKALIREQLKQQRNEMVENIIVTTSTGKQFNGDETSQTRMARAIIAMQAANVQSTTWVLATNDAVEVTVAELSEALVLAGQAQSAVWVIQE